MVSSYKQLHTKARARADRERREKHERFFQTGPGEYGEGDRFIGLTVPVCRALAKEFRTMPHEDVLEVLHSVFHEERLIALFILVDQFVKGDSGDKKKIYNAYLANTRHINNWDLVDSSAYQIVGTYLLDKKTTVLGQLARSKNLWERRIAMVSTFAFIRENRFDETLRCAVRLLHDKEDLIHKAVGWMLREVGKKDIKTLTVFLKKYYRTMPRTMLRYAIEKYPEKIRKQFLNGTASIK